MLASVLRLIDSGEFLKYLRFPSSPPKAPSWGRSRVLIQPLTISLGKAIVVLYIITFLAAVISARTLADKKLHQIEIPGVDPDATVSSSVNDEEPVRAHPR
jgi:hypothetical protein